MQDVYSLCHRLSWCFFRVSVLLKYPCATGCPGASSVFFVLQVAPCALLRGPANRYLEVTGKHCSNRFFSSFLCSCFSCHCVLCCYCSINGIVTSADMLVNFVDVAAASVDVVEVVVDVKETVRVLSCCCGLRCCSYRSCY